MKQLLRHLAPALLLGALMACVYVLPTQDALLESSISPDLPTGYRLDGWYGTKTQESEVERATLAVDTKFSKAVYREDTVSLLRSVPDVNVSIVYSGSDMNNSIHRPERCLPAQGHMNLKAEPRRFKLKNGREITFTRLTSFVPQKDVPGGRIRFVHYYAFIGHGVICHNHLQRTAMDMYDRVLRGAVERWAYIQVGTCWGEAWNVSEQQADERIIRLLGDLLPGQVRWQEIR